MEKWKARTWKTLRENSKRGMNKQIKQQPKENFRKNRNKTKKENCLCIFQWKI